MSLQGSLREMSVADLIQHYCDDHKNARLSISHGEKEAVVYFKEGNVVHASLGEMEGEEVIYQILGWEDGAFTLMVNAESPKETLTRSWAGLLMEGAKRLDETKHSHGESKAEIKIDQNRLLQTLEEIQKNLGGGVISADIWQKSSNQMIAGLKAPQLSTALFKEITSYLSSTLAVSVFPPLGSYYLLDLEQDKVVVVVNSTELLLAMLIDISKITLGLVINLGIPLAQKGLAEATL